MSDKLKVMQTHITDDENSEDRDLCSASIGYPDLKTVPSNETKSHGVDQPEIDECEFDRLVEASEESRLIA